MNNKAQALTLEGVTAALLLLLVLYTLFQSSLVISPVWSELGDAQLKQIGYDTLRVLDRDESYNDSLKYMLYHLNKTDPEYPKPNEEFINSLETLLTSSIRYRLEVSWTNITGNSTLRNFNFIENLVLINNTPTPDAVMVSRLVVLDNRSLTPSSPFMPNLDNVTSSYPIVVEVRLILWAV
ncbi:hypothetical protein DRO97_03900 [Archaeoglobales archaeon]|nr:MAG: hypothetical protein DRO97_03900 [Archaeoglobales archaeon]